MQHLGEGSSRGTGLPGLPDAVMRALVRTGVPVVTDPDLLAGHTVDWTGHWTGQVLALVRPRTTQQVVGVLQVARDHRVPVQVQGGNTGLVGGSVPAGPALLLSTRGLDRIGPVDVLERTVVVGAGVTAAALASHAARAGLRFGVDLAARDSATVGGMAATNAGGLGVVAHGTMRDNVRGLTAVLADGRVVRTVGRPRKDNSGYDLTNLLVGSEGTLGVITEVEVVLHDPPAQPTVALLAVADLAGAVAAARAVQAAGPLLLAAEVVDAPGVRRVAAALGLADPLPPGSAWLLLLEVADGGGGQGLAPVADQVLAVAKSPADRARLWAYRERQTEAYAQLPGEVDKLDVSVRLDRLDLAVARIREAVGTGAVGGPGSGAAGAPGPVAADVPQPVAAVGPEPGVQARPGAGSGRDIPGGPWVGFFGHVLDGNLHVQLVDSAPGASRRVLDLVAGLGGSISAEHGIGRLKAEHLALARSADEIAWLRQVRATVDPQGLLNPGVLLAP